MAVPRTLPRVRTPAAVIGGSVAAVGLATLVGAALPRTLPSALADVLRPLPLAVALLLAAATLPMVASVAGNDRRLRRLFFAALGLKISCAFARHYVAFGVYGGAADASYYDSAGKTIAEQVGWGVWTTSQVTFQQRGGGTSNLAFIVGWVYHLLTPDIVVGFVVFTWLGFLGLVLFYRAGAVALPGVDRYRLAALTMLLPSLLFWPSGLSKDAWMQFTLGVTAFGVAQLLGPTRRWAGLLWCGAGLAGAALVRPHMAFIVTAALVGAVLLRRSKGRSTHGSRMVVAVLGVGVLLVLSAQVERLLGAELVGGSAPSVLDVTLERSNEGGSQFEARPVTNPLMMPVATFSVLFRPLPFEARNVQALLTSAEGLLLLVICVRNRARIMQTIRSAPDHPYILFCLLYGAAFVVGFSNIGNFGILARQRAQLYPMFVVLLAMPAAVGRVRRTVPSDELEPQPA